MLKNDWLLAGFWLCVPLLIGVGIVFDGFKAPMDTQMFLGAGNNFVLLLMLLGVVTCVRLVRLNWTSDRPFILAWTGLISWSIGTMILNGTHFLPLVYVFLLISLGVLMLRARSLAKTDLSAFHKAFFLSVVGITIALVLSTSVHLLGPLPERQIFLYVDGFANIRTFGETALLAWLAGLAFLVTREHRLAACVILVVSGTLMFWSGTRAAWVGAAAAFGLVVLVRRAWLSGALAAGLTGLAMGASLLLPLPGHEYGLVRAELLSRDVAAVNTPSVTINQDGEVTPAASGTGSTRMALWTWGFNKTMDAPLTGYGPMRMMLMEDRPDRLKFAHLHNLPLDLAFWFGWPMAIIVLCAMLWGWVGLVRASWKNVPGAPLWLSISTGLCVTSLFAGTLVFPVTLTATAIALAMGPVLGRRYDTA